MIISQVKMITPINNDNVEALRKYIHVDWVRYFGFYSSPMVWKIDLYNNLVRVVFYPHENTETHVCFKRNGGNIDFSNPIVVEVEAKSLL